MKTIIFLSAMHISQMINPTLYSETLNDNIGYSIIIFLICLITDSMNFNKLHFKD